MATDAREGVGHARLADPEAGTLEILRLEGGGGPWLAAHCRADIVRAEPFAEVELGLWRGAVYIGSAAV